MRISAKCGENTRDISTLKCISDLDSKESKTKVKKLSKGQVAFFCHDVYFIDKYYVFAKRRQRYYFFFTRAREKSKKVHFLECKRFRKQGSGSENWVNETFLKALAEYIRYYNNDRIKLRLNMSPVQYRQIYMNNMSMNMHTINNIY